MKSGPWISLLIFQLIFSASLSTKGQISSVQGWFEADFSQGCLPLTVTVTTPEPDANVPIFQFEGRDDTNLFPWDSSLSGISYTYTSSGTYMIYLTIQTLNTNRQDSLEITVIDSQIPEFEIRSCEGNGVVVDITDSFYDGFEVDFGDGTLVTLNAGDPNPSHTYADTQTYSINVTGRLSNAPNNCLSASSSFTPSAQLITPSIDQVSVLDTDEIDIAFTLPQNLIYRLEASAGDLNSFQLVQLVDPSFTTVLLTGFSPELQQYCFRITAFDPCTGNTVSSNNNCTLSTQLEIVNNENQLSWQTISQGTETYQIARNTIPNFISFAAGVFSFDDRQVVCNTDYCYGVTINYNNGSQSISKVKCGTAFSTDTPPTIQDISVDVASLGVQVGWESLPSLEESFFRVTASNGIELQTDTTDLNPSFFDLDLEVYPQTCYQHTYKDICGNISTPGVPICSILISGVSNPEGSISLQWTTFEGWTSGVQNYVLEKYTFDGTLIESQDMMLETSFFDEVDGPDQLVSYRVIANPVNPSLIPARSNVVDLARRAQLHYPTAFTPDGDGLNDVFLPGDILFINSYLLQIYDRWGELIFSTEDPSEGWDGSIKGTLATEGSYTYYAQTEDFRGLKISRTGVVLLLSN